MSTLALISIVVTATALLAWLNARTLRLPMTIGIMLLTILGAVVMSAASGAFPGVHDWAAGIVDRVRFEDLILHGMLGLLLFAGSFLLDLQYLKREKLAVTLLALFGTLISAGAVASLMYWLLPLVGMHPHWIECIFFGALISPTDPIAVLEMLHRTGVAKNIQAQLAGESLFNDGVGAVLFLAALSAARGSRPTAGHLALSLMLQSGGGLLLGVALAWFTSEMMRLSDAYQIEIMLTLSLALGGYCVAESLHVSAPLEAVAAGLALRRFNLNHHHAEIAHESLDRFWTVIDEIQNALLFVLVGLEVLAIPFSGQTMASGGVAIAVVTCVRLGAVSLVLWAVRLLQRGHETSIVTLTWGGLRGGLSIALALAVPEGQGRVWILVTTYVVVVFSIVVQGGTLDIFLKRMKGQRRLA
ncbi:sodium/proton antiporter, CPA1 family [Granulicella rosea]|uniref:Sodium/proton antiporter, CPA1 family n=1 Tax=Granulicella rosea TaxID=474952 RepID=A0A239DAL0_9BACT|nr:sodium:proton antiporter [Granulicella rosea]SNS29466.1 sodium/proton antiporter, CPA1 family [Granulicella rosea]